MKRGTTRHPKTLALQTELRIPKREAVGILEMLWQWAAEYTPDGAVGRYRDTEIAAGIEWERDASELIEALVTCRYLDRVDDASGRLLVHDWPEHADDTVHRAMARAGRRFADGSTPRLSRLSKREQEEARKRFQQNDVEPVRTLGAQSAHDVRTEYIRRAHVGRPTPPRLAPPCPALPAAAPAGAAAAAPRGGRADEQPQPQPMPAEPDVGALLAAKAKLREWAAEAVGLSGGCPCPRHAGATTQAELEQTWVDHWSQPRDSGATIVLARLDRLTPRSEAWLARTLDQAQRCLRDLREARKPRHASEWWMWVAAASKRGMTADEYLAGMTERPNAADEAGFRKAFTDKQAQEHTRAVGAR